MNINFILGRAGTGKSTKILKEMIENKNNTVFIVPEQYSLSAEKDLLDFTKATNVNVLSFKRLSIKIFYEFGLKDKVILDDVAKAMLLRKIMIDVKKNLVYYKNIKITQGFIQKLSHTISMLEAGGLGQLNTSINSLDTNIYYKTKDILLIYNTFIEYTQNNYISTEQALDITAQKIKNSNFLKNTDIYIDSFNSFTNLEYKVLTELFAISNKSTIILTTDIDNFEIEKSDIFFETKTTLSKLYSICKKLNAKIENIFLTKNVRHKDNDEMLEFEKNIFEINHSFSYKTNNIKFHEYNTIYDEVFGITTDIFKLLEDGYKFSDIAIIIPEKYHLYVENIFKEVKIPFFIDKTKDISTHPIINTLKNAIEIVINGWSADNVFSFLKSGLIDIEYEDIDLVENYVLAYNIKNYKWKLDWQYKVPWASEEDNEKILKYINIVKLDILGILVPFEEAFKNKTVEETVLGIFKAMQSANIFKNILIDQNIELKKENILVYNKLVNLFEIMSEFLGDKKISKKEFLEIIDSGSLKSTRGKIPEISNSILVASFERSKLPNVSCIFAVGISFAFENSNYSLYSDIEKAKVNSFGANLILENDILFENNFKLYSHFSKPSKKLFISYSKKDIKGSELQTSPIVTILKNKNISDDVKHKKITKNLLFKKLCEDIHNYYKDISKNEVSKEVLQLYSYFLKKGYNLKKIEELSKGIQIPTLSKENINLLYKERINTSISKLEKYAVCPYSYFARYNLRASERKIFEFSKLQTGDIYHQLLNDFFKNTNYNLRTITRDDIAKIVNEIMINIKDKYKVFVENPKESHILKRLENIAMKSIWALSKQYAQGDFEIFDTEVEFGKENIQSIVVDINDKNKFVINGKIDRIDILQKDENKFVKIIDYKSSERRLQEKDINIGIGLQLIVYLKSILEQKKFFKNDNIIPAGIFYFVLDNPFLENLTNDIISHTDILEKKILEEFSMNGFILDDTIVLDAIQKEIKVIKESKNSKYEIQDFKRIMDNATEVLKDIGKEILSGNISPFSFKNRNKKDCEYCEYKPICNFKDI
ncbi:MAG: PD-(D/E)XK nuclease family protein [Defluviitaleaceae bacterium]|nr:PD-(D/E)XK nuclease family protein [Defluviitaleaceae bacterium]